MQPLKWLKKLMRSERGNAIIICAATLPLVIGAAAIGVDTIQVSLARRQLQRAADSAAIAGAYAKLQSQNVNTAVTHDLAFNNDVTLSGSPTIENAPTVGAYAGNTRAVRVVLTATRAVPFMHFFTGSSMTVTTEATAMSVYTGQFCMISLETGNVTGITFSGNSTVNLGCGVTTNARSSAAVSASGSAVVTASPVAAVGGVPSSGAYASGTTLLPYSPAQADPYALVPNPTVPSGCNAPLNVQPNNTVNLTSASANPVGGSVYCFAGADIKGTLNLPAGATVIINGSTLNFGAQANVTGTGITFVLTSSTAATDPSSIAQLSMNAQATLNITAPDTGTYSGLLFYQDRRAPTGTTEINGNSSTTYRGGMYFPRRSLTFNGTSGMHTECIQLVALRLTMSGNNNIQNTCPANSGSKAFDATFVRLVA